MESSPWEGILLALPEANEKNTLTILLLTWLCNFAADVVFLTVKRKKAKNLKIPSTAV